jgi:hypothetical protein
MLQVHFTFAAEVVRFFCHLSVLGKHPVERVERIFQDPRGLANLTKLLLHCSIAA